MTILVIISCLCSACLGFCVAAIFNGQSYDQGFDEGWRQRGILDKHEGSDSE